MDTHDTHDTSIRICYTVFATIIYIRLWSWNSGWPSSTSTSTSASPSSLWTRGWGWRGTTTTSNGIRPSTTASHRSILENTNFGGRIFNFTTGICHTFSPLNFESAKWVLHEWNGLIFYPHFPITSTKNTWIPSGNTVIYGQPNNRCCLPKSVAKKVPSPYFSLRGWKNSLPLL